MTKHCINEGTADVARLEERKSRGEPILFGSGLSEVTTGFFLCAKPEILAMKGAFAEAEAALSDAEKFEQEHPNSSIGWSIAGSPLATAKAFLLEKKGDLNGAAAAYEAILVDAKVRGAANPSNVINGRLAVIALLRGDDTAAERWSKNALSIDPGAKAVLGSLLQKRGDNKGAKEQYRAALKLIGDAAKSEHLSLPIDFAEQKRAKEGLNK